MIDWTQTLNIIITLLGVTAWLDYKHREDLKALKDDLRASDRRWQWLFDWAHYEVNDLKSRHPASEKKQ